MIDRRGLRPATIRALDRCNALSKERRDRNRASGECINQTIDGSHGPPVEGTVRCAACLATHRKQHEVGGAHRAAR